MKNELDKELSLITIMKGDPSFSERIKKVSKKIQKDRRSVLNMANQYSKKYEREIAEGTEQEKLLLTEGANNGLSRNETMTRYGRFLPTVRTPILNWLYFFMEEEKGIMNESYLSEQAMDSRMTSINLMLAELNEPQIEWEDFRNFSSELVDEITDKIKSQHNKRFGGFEHSGLNKIGEYVSKDLEAAPEMMEYLYGNLTLDTFNKLKKLKALTKSPNENEAFRAYRTCMKLCDKYGLEFDKIPLNI